MALSRRRANTEGAKSKTMADHRGGRNSAASSSFGFDGQNSSSSDLSLHRVSHDGRSYTGTIHSRGDRPESLARSLFSRSTRVLKRQNSKFNLASLRTLQWLDNTEDRDSGKHIQEVSGIQVSKHTRTYSIVNGRTICTLDTNHQAHLCVPDSALRHAISEPYNFQHLTHTGAHQFREMHRTSDNELVTEFSAIRAAQAPHRELKGIRAEILPKDLMSPDFPFGSPLSCLAESISPSLLTMSQDPRIKASSESQPETIDLRQSRSIDGFTRINSKSFSSPTPPISPPGKVRSKLQHDLSHDSRFYQDSPTAPTFASAITNDDSTTSDGADPLMSPTNMLTFGKYLGEADESCVGHAVTTPDDTAYPLKPNAFGSPGVDVADVPDEDEGYSWIRAPTPISLHSSPGSAIRHSKSLPNTRSIGKDLTLSFQLTSVDAQPFGHSVYGPCTDSFLQTSDQWMEEIPVVQRMSQRMSVGLKGIDDHWEDDIDYCYEHAAEADCDFDWNRRSVDAADLISSMGVAKASGNRLRRISIDHPRDNDSSNGDTVIGSQVTTERADSFSQSHQGLSRLSIPGLGTSSAESLQSSAVSVSEVNTPSQITMSARRFNLAGRSSKGSDMFPLTPSLLIPHDFENQMLHEGMYHELIVDGAASKHHYPLYDHRVETRLPRSDSLLSNDSPLSKCTSQDSGVVSRPASIHGHNRNNESFGSLPELLHSNTSREKLDKVAEQLAEHIASLNNCDGSSDELAPSAPSPRKRNNNLAKEVAHKLVLKTSTSFNSIEEDEEGADTVVTPLASPDCRSRAQSDLATRTHGTHPQSARNSFVGRDRSASATTSNVSPKKLSRVSYSLFPPVTSPLPS